MADTSDLLSRLLSDPNSLRTLSQLLANTGIADKKETAEPVEPKESLPSEASSLLPTLSVPNMSSSRDMALLAALRPYMSEGRQKRLDGLIQAFRVASMIKQYRNGI